MDPVGYRNIPPKKTLTNMTVWAGRFSPLFLCLAKKRLVYIFIHGCFSIVMLVFRGVDLNLSRVVFGQVNFFFFFAECWGNTHETFWTLWCNVDVEMSIFFFWLHLKKCQQLGCLKEAIVNKKVMLDIEKRRRESCTTWDLGCIKPCK